MVWPLFAALMGFAFGGSIVWGIMYSPPQHHAANNHQADEHPAAKISDDHPKVESLWVPTDSVGLYTLVLAVLTGVLAASTIGLWIVTWRASASQARDMKASIAASEKSVEIASNAMVAGERAFLFATGFEQFYELDTTTGHFNWRFKPIWRNSGNTPTKELTISTICEIGASTLPDDFDFDIPSGIVGGGLLGPKYENLGGIAPPYPLAPVTTEDLLAAQNGTKYIYLIGWAKYRDVFPNTDAHITRFCWIILPNGDPLTFVPNDKDHALGFPYAHHQKGNSADD
jgi:hypothetical protein